MIKWLKKQKDIFKKSAGIEEKKKSTEEKIRVAMSILNERRKINLEVPFDRRRIQLERWSC